MKPKTTYKKKPLLDQLAEIRNTNRKDLIRTISADESSIKRVVSSDHIDKLSEVLVNSSKQIVIYGDFDADGMTASSVARLALPESTIFIPDRKDGYGLSDENIRLIGKESIILTVDCGISFIERADSLNEEGFEIIITDHHEPTVLSSKNTIVINPKFTNHGYEYLCGAGVAYTLARDLGLLNKETNSYALQLAAIGTICDMVSMTDDNRIIARRGIEEMKKNPMPAVLAMAEASGMYPDVIDEETISWYFGPLLNSASRMGLLHDAVNMLVSDNVAQAKSIAKELKKAKTKEKKFSDLTMSKMIAKQKIFRYDGITIVDATEWPDIVTGTTANQIGRLYKYPVMVYTRRNDTFFASIRSTAVFNAFGLVRKLIDNNLIDNGGGHKEAAGFHWSKNNTQEVLEFVENYATDVLLCNGEEETYDADFYIDFIDMLELYKEYEQNKPYGIGFEKPTFLVKLSGVSNYKTMGNGEHCSFEVYGIPFVAFGLSGKIKATSDRILAVCELSKNQSIYGKKNDRQILVRNVEIL